MKIKGLTAEQETQLKDGELSLDQVAAILEDHRPHLVHETRGEITLAQYERPNRNAAIAKALEMAYDNDMIRGEESGDDFMGSGVSFTHDELRIQLLRTGYYHGEREYKVQVLPR